MNHLATTGVVVAALATAAAIPAFAQTAATDEIARYRQMLADGNPAELWEARGEDLWKKKVGPKNASLEQCDLGKGAGVVKGAYAELPRYFKDSDKVMDLEQRLIHCRTTLQGLSDAEAVKTPFGSGFRISTAMLVLPAVARGCTTRTPAHRECRRPPRGAGSHPPTSHPHARQNAPQQHPHHAQNRLMTYRKENWGGKGAKESGETACAALRRATGTR